MRVPKISCQTSGSNKSIEQHSITPGRFPPPAIYFTKEVQSMFSGNLGSDIPIELIQELEKRDPAPTYWSFSKYPRLEISRNHVESRRVDQRFVKANSAKILGLLGWSQEEEAVLARARGDRDGLRNVNISLFGNSRAPQSCKELRNTAMSAQGYVRACGNTGQNTITALDSAISMIRTSPTIATDQSSTMDIRWEPDSGCLGRSCQEFERAWPH